MGGGDEGGGENPGDCTEKAPPDSFEADIQWTWAAPEPNSVVTPLVANFTDDNGDGKIDVCSDIPDVVIVSMALVPTVTYDGFIYVLDGATGTPHFRIADPVYGTCTPAIGDIDHDGLVEIVAAVLKDGATYTGAYEHDGTLKWLSPTPWPSQFEQHASFALADLDTDGDVEILVNNEVYDHDGNRLWTAATPVAAGLGSATTAADLDGDGKLEVVLSNAAYHHDGSPYFVTNLPAGYPQIANLDADPEPEILLTNQNGLNLLEHTGAVKYSGLMPTGDPPEYTTWAKPATVHDFDGNGVAEFATGSALHYTVYNADASIVWSAAVQDQSGSAAGTAFDFLGDGKAEAMYADEYNFHIFNELGVPYFSVPRVSGTAIEYPTVADIDNDGSSEIVLTSQNFFAGDAYPTVQVIRDKQDRWIQSRRIWNQHTYHVTNVNEDGTIPQFERPSWKYLNTFRTNAQISAGGVCRPIPEG